MRPRSHGFTLLELLVVAVCVFVLYLIVAPYIHPSKQASATTETLSRSQSQQPAPASKISVSDTSMSAAYPTTAPSGSSEEIPSRPN